MSLTTEQQGREMSVMGTGIRTPLLRVTWTWNTYLTPLSAPISSPGATHTQEAPTSSIRPRADDLQTSTPQPLYPRPSRSAVTGAHTVGRETRSAIPVLPGELWPHSETFISPTFLSTEQSTFPLCTPNCQGHQNKVLNCHSPEQPKEIRWLKCHVGFSNTKGTLGKN